jgi:hypothetical protein
MDSVSTYIHRQIAVIVTTSCDVNRCNSNICRLYMPIQTLVTYSFYWLRDNLYPQKLALLRLQAAAARSAYFARGSKPRNLGFFFRLIGSLLHIISFHLCLQWNKLYVTVIVLIEVTYKGEVHSVSPAVCLVSANIWQIMIPHQMFESELNFYANGSNSNHYFTKIPNLTL